MVQTHFDQPLNDGLSLTQTFAAVTLFICLIYVPPYGPLMTAHAHILRTTQPKLPDGLCQESI